MANTIANTFVLPILPIPPKCVTSFMDDPEFNKHYTGIDDNSVKYNVMKLEIVWQLFSQLYVPPSCWTTAAAAVGSGCTYR